MNLRLLAVLFLGACATEPDLDSSASAIMRDTETGDPVPPSLTNFCERVTVTGSVYYTDLRINGRFDLRDREPAPFYQAIIGDTNAPGSAPYDPDASNLNYYGLRDAQVDIYEADLNYGSGASCSPTSLAGTTTVLKDGTFTWTGDVCETCGADLDGDQEGELSVAVKISLRNCTDPNTRCFSVRTPNADSDDDHFGDDWDGITWSQWFTGATNTGPERFRTQSHLPLGVHYFETAGDPTSQPAKAANVFASMVDVTRKVHMTIGLDFDQPEVKAFFPGTNGTHSHPSGRLCVDDPGNGKWVDGKEAPHEYGHLLHYWAWDGNGKWTDYCFDSDGDGHVDDADDLDGDNDFSLEVTDADGDGHIDVAFDFDGDGDFVDECRETFSQQEYANTAFKEGWADFVLGLTLDGTGSPKACDERTLLRGCPGQTCMTGRHYFDDVTVALCDVWDSSVDTQYRDHTHFYDHTDLTLIEMWNGLEDMWDHASAPTRETVEEATSQDPAGLSVLGVCGLMQELDYDPNLEETLAVDGLDCSL